MLALLLCYISKKKSTEINRYSFWFLGNVLSFQAVASQVFSTMRSLTSVFGMRTGGPSLYRHWLWYIHKFP